MSYRESLIRCDGKSFPFPGSAQSRRNSSLPAARGGRCETTTTEQLKQERAG